MKFLEFEGRENFGDIGVDHMEGLAFQRVNERKPQLLGSSALVGLQQMAFAIG